MGLPAARLGRTLLLTVVLSSAAGLLAAPLMLSRRHAPSPSVGAEAPTHEPGAQAREAYGRIPLSFEVNRGQAESSVDFLARGAGYTLFLKPAEAVFALRAACGTRDEDRAAGRSVKDAEHSLKTGAARQAAGARSAACDRRPKVLRMRLVGADASAAAEAVDELAGRVNYFVGDDPSRWRTNVPTYGRVRYAEVYPGVDVVYYGNQRQLEYDFRVAPGSDPRAVALQFEGADEVEIDASGDLLLTLGESVVRQPKPFVYQEVAGARRAVEGGYVLGEGRRVGFRVGGYDPSLPLVIDPTIVYSTYLGGSAGDIALAVAVDSGGNAYVAGFTASTNFPTANALQAASGGRGDAFVAKLNADGSALVYSTYLGGSGIDQAVGVAVDSGGNVYLTGSTGSTNFPVANPIQATKGPTNEDAFVTKLDATGTALVYSTYLGGGTGSELGTAIAVDSFGNAYVAGSTSSTDFPVADAIQAANGGGSTDAFVTKVNNTGGAFLYSTYLGGNDDDVAIGLAVDSNGSAYLTGSTRSSNFPVASPIQAANGGGGDSFVTKLNVPGTALVYSTYLGGSSEEVGQAIAVDSAGNAYVAGSTSSTNFPVANAFQAANGGGAMQDATLTKVNAAGSALVFSTYFGGTGGEIAFGVGLDSAGNVYLGGTTGSPTSLPTANAVQCAGAGGSDAFVAKLNAAGTALVYSTYLGGGATDDARGGLAVDSAGNAYLAGSTLSTDFPVVNAVQAAFGGNTAVSDAFVTKISDASSGPAPALQFSQTTYTVDEDVTFVNVVVNRTGDTTGAVTVDYATADGTASERSDYTTALGTLRFAAGQTSATVPVLISEDSFAEGTETFTIALSNPTGGALPSCQTAVATVQITDDAAEPPTNVIDDPTVFTGQHYHDFLNRQADAGGLNFWASQIIACGGDAACVDRARAAVSQAFFLSIEFQQTGFLVHRFYKASFTDSPARPRGLARYREFLRDTQEIGRGVVVGAPGWEQLLEANKRAFTLRWVQRPDFIAEFPVNMGFDAYVAKLAANSGTTLTPVEINIAFESYSNTPQGRANALRAVLESASVYNAQFNTGFVLAQYIGYLRRNPNDPPNTDFSGFDFWLAKMNSFSLPGEDLRFNEQAAIARVTRAEMVRAFIVSQEYRQRFGRP